MTPFKAIHTFCSRQCMPSSPYIPDMPRNDYLKCDSIDCPLWRHRAGSLRPVTGGKRFPKASHATQQCVLPPIVSPKARARAKILQVEQEAKKTGKHHFTPSEWRPYGELEYRPGETPLKAIRRHCTDCMGSPYDLKLCCSPKCPLHEYRFGHKTKAAAPP